MKNFKKVLSLALVMLMVVSALIAVPVDAKADTTTYTQVTSLDDVTGDVIIVAENRGSYFALGTKVDSKITAVNVTVTDGKIVGDNLPVWTIASEGQNVSLFNGTNYLSYGSSTNFNKSATSANSTNEQWKVTESGVGFRFTSVKSSNRAIAYQFENNGTSYSRYGAYAVSNAPSSLPSTTGYIFDLLVFKVAEEESEVETTTYIVAGTPGLCGSEWNASDVNNKMTLVDGIYTKTYANVPAAEGYQLKVVKNSADGQEWIGDATGNNITFNVTAACDVTVTYDPATGAVSVSGANVVQPNELKVDFIIPAGSGNGPFLNDVQWDPTAYENKMTNNGSNVWSISFEGVSAETYKVKFAANGNWNDNWGGTVTLGEWTDAVYNGGDIEFTVAKDDSTVTLYLDLSNFDYASKTGAKLKIEVTEKEEEVVVPTTPKDILDAAYALESGSALEGTYTLTGIIQAVNSAYSDKYKNITVTMIVDGMTDKPIQCFRLAGEGADVIGVGDEITVTGTIKKFNSTVEFDAGCTLDSYKDNADPTPDDITVDDTLTDLEKLAIVNGLAIGQSTVNNISLTGVVVKIDAAYSEEHGNISVYIQIGEDEKDTILCYRIKGEGADKLAEGDKITVTGKVKNYNKLIEFIAGSTFVYVTDDEGTGNEGTGNEGTGNEGTGNEGTGNEGTGNEGTGNEGTGNEGTENEDTEIKDTGDNVLPMILVLFAGCAMVAVAVIGKRRLA